MRITPTRARDGRLLLNVGCGATFSPEWTNVDLAAAPPHVSRVDLRRPLPFDDATFSAVYSSHVLEHFPPDDGEGLLREMARCLAPGGTCRIVVPDFEAACREYLARTASLAAGGGSEDARAAERRRHHWALVQVIDQFVRTRSGGLTRELILAGAIDVEYVRRLNGPELLDTVLAGEARRRNAAPGLKGALTWLVQRLLAPLQVPRRTGELHRWAYDSHSLGDSMRRVGLVNVRAVTYDESGIVGWAGFGLDATPAGTAPRKPGSLYMEGDRP
jgi:predicted SAM-dependent methyltransferase